MSISIRHISKSFGEQRALDDVSAEIGEGRIVGLLGPNGAGKSTLMKIATGYVRADGGSVSVCGQDIEADPVGVRRLIGYLPEHNPLYLDMYVREYLGMVAGMYGKSDVGGRVDELVEMTGLTPEAHKKIGALSKGYRQRVGISQALVGDPLVVILDEPTTGLDPNQIVEIRELIRSLAKQRTVVLSTHIMQEVEAVCDDIIIIDHGHIKAQGPADMVVGMVSGGQTVEVEFVRGPDVEELRKAVGADKVSVVGPRTVSLSAKAAEADMRPLVFEYAVRTGNALLRLQQMNADIETLFHRLTQERL